MISPDTSANAEDSSIYSFTVEFDREADYDDATRYGKGKRFKKDSRGRQEGISYDWGSGLKPRGQKATQQAMAYDDMDVTTSYAMLGKNRGRLNLPRRTKWDSAGRPRKDKYRQKDFTDDHGAYRYAYGQLTPNYEVDPQNQSNSVDVVSASEGCSSKERQRNDEGRGIQCVIEASVEPTLGMQNKSYPASAETKRVGSKGRKPALSNKRFIDREPQTQLVETATDRGITGNRGNGEVIASETKQPNTLEVRYHRPKKVGKYDRRQRGWRRWKNRTHKVSTLG